MEVHTHTHTARKKWTHYFWEFLMLFLAVTLGFFVENQREHFVEVKREKQFIRSMVEDLKHDTTSFSLDNIERTSAVEMFDSVIPLLNKKARDQFEKQRLYYLVRMAFRHSPFPIMNDRTFEQMKSSGNLRLIHDNAIADRITSYYFNSKEFSLNVQQTLLRLQSFIGMQAKVFDGAVFQSMISPDLLIINPPEGNPPLITEDKKILNELSVHAHYVVSILKYSRTISFNLSKEASQLIELLNKEYHLK